MVKQAERVRAEYRAWLQVDPELRREDADRKRFEFERAERARKFEAHEATEGATAKHRDSRLMLAGDQPGLMGAALSWASSRSGARVERGVRRRRSPGNPAR